MGNRGVTPPKISSLSIDWSFDYHPLNQYCPLFYGDAVLFVSHKYILVQWTSEYQVHSSHTLGSHTEQLKLCWDHYQLLYLLHLVPIFSSNSLFNLFLYIFFWFNNKRYLSNYFFEHLLYILQYIYIIITNFRNNCCCILEDLQ